MSMKGRRRGGRGVNNGIRNILGDGFESMGGYLSAKRSKLLQQYQDEPNDAGVKSDIFKGISIFVNGYTDPSPDDLKKLMKAHGGVYHHYYRRETVTHIIAINLPNSKIEKLTDKKVVKPSWITDSVKAGKLLSYEDYLLYTAKSTIQPGLLRYKVTSIPRQDSGLNPIASTTPPRVEAGEDSSNDDSTSTEPCHHDMEHSAEEDELSNIYDAETDKSSDGMPESFEDKSEHVSPVAGPSHEMPPEEVPRANILSPAGKTSTRMGKAGDANFVAEYYSNSRLHHLSTWGAEYKDYVTQLQAQGSTFPGREELRRIAASSAHPIPKTGGKPRRVIMHIDMDSFFVSVGLRNRPDLKGKPVAVTHSSGVNSAKGRQGADYFYEQAYYQQGASKKKSGGVGMQGGSRVAGDNAPDEEEEGDVEMVAEGDQSSKDTNRFHSMAEIASCSYEARQAGVKNGMFMGPARALCPDLVTIPYDFDGYREVSQALYNTVARFTHDIEAVSCDEMFVDLTDLITDTGASPEDIASIFRQEIFEKTKCNASAGMGPNILLARLATRVAKPNGQFLVAAEMGKDFIKDKSVKDLPGVGRALSNKLNTLNVSTCEDLQRLSLGSLQKEFGPKTGESLHRSCRGIDDRPIKMEQERKSISAEINYGIRFKQDIEVEKFVSELAEEVRSRMEKIKVRGKTITLKLKIRREGTPEESAKFMGHGICDNVAKSVTLPIATEDAKIIATECMSLLHPLKIPATEFRGMGIQLSRLESTADGKAAHAQRTPSILNFTMKVDESKSTAPLESNFKSPGIHQARKAQESFPPPLFKSPPPLPTLPSFKSPEPSTRTPVDAADLYLPSPSQVDPDVLRELPSDIRQQIESAMESSKQRRNKLSRGKRHVDTPVGAAGKGPRLTRNLSQVAGCSSWTGGNPPCESAVDSIRTAAAAKEDIKENDAVVALPNMSQIDPTCFEALPKELQEELKAAYKTEQKKQRPAANLQPRLTRPEERDLHSVMMAERYSPRKMSPAKQSRKGGSPGKRGKGSPVNKGTGRGRKKKYTSPRKLEFASAPGAKEDVLAAFETKEAPVQPVPSTSATTEVIMSADQVEAVHRVNLCGAVTLAEVKNLIIEWTQSTTEPEAEDIGQLIQYMADLIEDHNLEKVYLVVRFLHRRIRKMSGPHEWGCCYSSVVSQTQSLVKAIYGSLIQF